MRHLHKCPSTLVAAIWSLHWSMVGKILKDFNFFVCPFWPQEGKHCLWSCIVALFQTPPHSLRAKKKRRALGHWPGMPLPQNNRPPQKKSSAKNITNPKKELSAAPFFLNLSTDPENPSAGGIQSYPGRKTFLPREIKPFFLLIRKYFFTEKANTLPRRRIYYPAALMDVFIWTSLIFIEESPLSPLRARYI